MSDHSSDSDSDHAMDDVQEENAYAEDMQTIQALTASLESNPYQYNAYTELITLLKKQGMLDELRATRRKMSAMYPLSEELWMSWIQDEMKLADSDEESQAVINLFKKATTDYLSVPIWVAFTEFMVQGHEDVQEGNDSALFTVDAVREVFNQAYDALKWHIPKSHLIWNAWLAFEKDIFAEKASLDDIQRVKKMCVERLAVPHMELEKTFSEEISSFVSNYLPTDYESTMVELREIVAQTRKALSKLEKFEQSLIDTQSSIASYGEYLKHETRQNTIEYHKLRTLYERAVASQPLVAALWDDYLVMLMNTKQTGLDRDQVIQTCDRAVRNCPWSGGLWAKYLILVALHLRSKAEAADIFERAIGDPMLSANAEELTRVCLEYSSFLRRFITSSSADDLRQELRQVLTKSQQLILAAGGDPYFKLDRFWIDLEAFVFDNPTSARNMWKNILDATKTSASTWLESINMELRLGDYDKARRLFRMAAQTKGLDWPTTMYDAWVSFEQEYGGVEDLKSVYIAISKHSSSLDNYLSQMYGQGTTEPAQQSSEMVYSRDRFSRTDGKKRKASMDYSESAYSTGAPSKQQKPATTYHHSTGREEDTCFFKNFSPETSDGELQALFAQYGTIVRFSIPIDKVKKFRKGYGYVQFSDKSEARAALELNGRDCGGRGLIVQISDVTRAPARTQGALPPNDMKESDIRKLFSLHGEVTDIFIIRKSKVDGQPVAKVTFAKEEDAKKALELNGTSFMSCALKVQYWTFQSQKQFNKNVAKMEFQANAVTPATTVSAPQSAPQSVTMVSRLQPRTLSARKPMPHRSRAFARPTGSFAASSSSSSSATATGSTTTAAAPASKSQDDFRKILQQKMEQAQ
ncbi:RNA-binding protein 4F [Actinomortierella ambigua]|uniref:RNA-binding protein 4F n=1 Tax=Actinomortierella ambigua TaxID=1343610 RepID=A0A9P6PU24_9FUNG|nr:RNA-binding protein 4F [Actinomortierella ambigua]